MRGRPRRTPILAPDCERLFGALTDQAALKLGGGGHHMACEGPRGAGRVDVDTMVKRDERPGAFLRVGGELPFTSRCPAPEVNGSVLRRRTSFTFRCAARFWGLR